MQLTSGVVNLTGMLVYNTTATIGAVGIYYWNGATWVIASLPSTSAADSGKILVSNGTRWVPVTRALAPRGPSADTVRMRNFGSVSWTKILDTSAAVEITDGSCYMVPATGVEIGDLCVAPRFPHITVTPSYDYKRLYVYGPLDHSVSLRLWIRCYRPSM